MLGISPTSRLVTPIQAILAVGYVVVVQWLLAFQFFTGSWPLHFANVLLVTLMGLLLLFSVNFLLLRHSFLRLGMLTSLAVFIYYFVYNLQGHLAQLIYGLIQNPQYLINMLIFASAPFLVGVFFHSRLKSGENHA